MADFSFLILGDLGFLSPVGGGPDLDERLKTVAVLELLSLHAGDGKSTQEHVEAELERQRNANLPKVELKHSKLTADVLWVSIIAKPR